MAHRSLIVIPVLMLAILVAVERRSSGSVSGSVNPTVTFDGEVRGADGKEQYRFAIDVEPVIFRLLTVQNKFRLVRVRMQNFGTAPLTLSADNDRLELVPRSGQAVQAVLNLQRGDSTWWDSLDPSMRETLAYPVTLKGVPAPAGGARSPEALYFYAFFPAQVREVPAGFSYTIASLGQSVRIEHRAAAAR